MIPHILQFAPINNDGAEEYFDALEEAGVVPQGDLICIFSLDLLNGGHTTFGFIETIGNNVNIAISSPDEYTPGDRDLLCTYLAKQCLENVGQSWPEGRTKPITLKYTMWSTADLLMDDPDELDDKDISEIFSGKMPIN